MEDLKYNNGFVKIPRSILEWEWYSHPDVSRMYLHLKLKANYAAGKWQGLEIGIGEHITSLSKLSSGLGMSEYKVRESLNRLEESGIIKRTPSNKFTKIKLLNIEHEEESVVYNHKPVKNHSTSKTQSNHKQTTTNKKNKEKEESKERKEFFKNEVSKFSDNFSKEHLIGFYDYWSIENEQTGRLKFEEFKNWNLEVKLKSWITFPKTKQPKSFTKNRP